MYRFVGANDGKRENKMTPNFPENNLMDGGFNRNGED